MKLLASAALLLSIGCASTSTRDTIKPASIEMVGEFEAREAARFAHLTHHAETKVQVCVAPDGKVASAETVESSGSEQFDDAARRDVANATYEAYDAPAEVKVCNNLRVVLNED